MSELAIIIARILRQYEGAEIDKVAMEIAGATRAYYSGAPIETWNRRARAREQQQQEPVKWIKESDLENIENIVYCSLFSNQMPGLVPLYTHQQPQAVWFSALEDLAFGPQWGGDDILAYESWVRETARKALECQQPQQEESASEMPVALDLAAMMRRLIYQANKTKDAAVLKNVASQANDLLARHGLRGSVLRDDEQPQAQNDELEACPECGNEVRHARTGLLVCECPAPLAPRAAVPDGFKLVPIEPTEEMLDAWFQAERNDSSDEATIKWRSPYFAMLAAASAQPVDAQGGA